MANKIYDYLTPGDFTYDSDKIEIDSGIVKLKENLINVYARYHLESIDTGDSIEDTSDNGRDGIAVNSPLPVAGKLNNCLQFDGVNQYINCGDIAGFERNQPFSIEAWINTSSSAQQIIASKMDNSSPYRGWQFMKLTTNKIAFVLINDSSINVLNVQGNTLVNSGTWRHIIVTYDGSSDASGINIYVDSNLETMSTVTNTLSATIITTANCNIGARSGGLTWNGELDEVIIYDKELDSTEVTYKYNSGNGREREKYYLDKPTIEPTDLFDPSDLYSWDAFLETLGGGNEGSIGYNLYKVDKANKYYWNGGAWITGGSSSNYNSQATVNTNIGTFDASPDKIGFIAYLISDGDQAIELDENQITYTENQVPLVNAGSNKACKDNQSISPFSDCSFSDPDGTVDYVYYKVDGEVDTWSQIPQGGYGTLLEAVQAWTYQFTNIGIKTVRLQVKDNDDTTSEDDLTVTVSQYTVTFNVKNAIGNHVSNFYFVPEDGALPQLKSSPFTYDYDYKATPYETIFYKDDYVTSTVDVTSSDHTENVTLTEPIYEETSRIYHPIRIDVLNTRKSIIKTLVKGDTILFEVKVDADITDWTIRAELWDDGTIDIKKATSNSGGSDLEIEITDATGGVFIVKINKDETTDILDQANLEIEMETNEAKIYTTYQSILRFVDEKIGWETP